MAKKDLNNAVSDLLGGQQTKEAPKRVKRDARTRSRAQLAPAIDKNTIGYEVASILVNSEYYAKIKEIAYAENLSIKKVVEAAMAKAIENYEATHGELKIHKIKQGNEAELFI